MTRTFEFLNQIKRHNNREWFANHRALYEVSYNEVINLADQLIGEMNLHDHIETLSGKRSVYRIYRDVRFSKDQIPYKTNWGGRVKRATAALRGGYYYQIEPGNSFVMGGFFGPNSQDLLHIRKQIAQYSEPLREILESNDFKDFFGMLIGNQLKTTPRGFGRGHPDIDLLRYKQFLLKHSFKDDQVLGSDFVKIVSYSFKQMRPFLDYMSEILTTDLNGRSLINSN